MSSVPASDAPKPDHALHAAAPGAFGLLFHRCFCHNGLLNKSIYVLSLFLPNFRTLRLSPDHYSLASRDQGTVRHPGHNQLRSTENSVRASCSLLRSSVNTQLIIQTRAELRSQHKEMQLRWHIQCTCFSDCTLCFCHLSPVITLYFYCYLFVFSLLESEFHERTFASSSVYPLAPKQGTQ